jgi:hypothetical protein
VEVRSSTYVSYLQTLASVNAGRFRERGGIDRNRQFVKRAGNLGSLFSVGILCFTVVTVLAIGILSAYGSVLGILHAFAKQSRRQVETPALAPGQARAAHAGGN